MYLFYLINRIVDFESGMRLLPQIHERVGLLSEKDDDGQPRPLDDVVQSSFAATHEAPSFA
jgi:hypothetical protein